MKRGFPRALAVSVALAAVVSIGCSSDNSVNAPGVNGDGNNASGNNGSSGDGSGPNNFVPEVEDEFEFAEPAVVGPNVFVANETANTVAVIDSRSLAIRTVPVGFGPTRVVGPSDGGPMSRVFVLNEGASSVSVIEPESLEVETASVLRRANALAANPDGTRALAWYDVSLRGESETAGDLSALSVVTADGASYQVAVGFQIERIQFSEDGSSAAVVTDDGVSVVDLDTIAQDTAVPPVAVLPPDLAEFDRTDREVVVAEDASYAVARVASFTGLILTDLATGEQWRVALPAIPTDLDWVSGPTPQILAMLPSLDRALVADVPTGLVNFADMFPFEPIDPPDSDMGAVDAGDAGADASGMDTGTDTSMDSGTGTATDAGAADTGDASFDAAVDLGPPAGTVWSPAEGFHYIALLHRGLGAAEVAPVGNVALLFSTLEGRMGGELLVLEDLSQRGLAFEKGVRGAVSDHAGESFVVLHTREEGGVPPNATPADPEFIARSWGISIVDVASAATRLVLTEQKPGISTLWNDGSVARLYMIFEGPASENNALPSHRDVLRVDLDSFATETFRVPSLPDGLGTIPEAGKIYIDQKHPQGRLTFVDVFDDTRKTVTGYQLNAGID